MDGTVLRLVLVLAITTYCVLGQEAYDTDRDEVTTRKSRFLFEFSKDYDPPTLTWVPPNLTFSCDGRSPGYYADPEAKCQVYHLCMPDGRRYSMLCGIGTVFNQRTFVCDHWYAYPCKNAEQDYQLNNELWESFLLPPSGRSRAAVARVPKSQLSSDVYADEDTSSEEIDNEKK